MLNVSALFAFFAESSSPRTGTTGGGAGGKASETRNELCRQSERQRIAMARLARSRARRARSCPDQERARILFPGDKPFWRLVVGHLHRNRGECDSFLRR